MYRDTIDDFGPCVLAVPAARHHFNSHLLILKRPGEPPCLLLPSAQIAQILQNHENGSHIMQDYLYAEENQYRYSKTKDTWTSIGLFS
jgi:hypothetical protein